MISAGEAFLEASVRTGTPLALAALGELVAERAGVINIGLEGIVIAGAFGALVASGSGNVIAGFGGAALAGALVAALFALFVVTLRADQIITGTAINLLAFGLTGALYRGIYGATGAALTIPTSGDVHVPLAGSLPVLGAFLDQPVPTYLVYALVPLVWWWLQRTQWGLSLRAVGERPYAARVAGISAARMRWGAIIFGGLAGGLAGGTLVLSQAGTFAEGMSAGRGFVAIAIVALGRWTPGGVALAALLFGSASALQYVFQALGWRLPYQLFLALPYVLTLLALAGVAGRVRAPEALGQSG